MIVNNTCLKNGEVNLKKKKGWGRNTQGSGGVANLSWRVMK